MVTIIMCEGYWLCQGDGLEGTGANPNEAYECYLFRNGKQKE